MNTKRGSLFETLRAYQSDSVFNPYSDICPDYDRPESPAIRLSNLQKVVEASQSSRVDSIWLGRDLGHRGGRRTGIALTDEKNLPTASQVWSVELEKATEGESFSERTAATIWKFIEPIERGGARIFTWNLFPFHPYQNDNHLSNRKHTAIERGVGMEIFKVLVDITEPKRIVAIGNDACNCLSETSPDAEIFKVRHPSYGGEKPFSEQISKIYDL